MSQRRPAISVEPRPGGRWAIQKDGAKRASRVMDRKSDAVTRARQQARREQVELVIKDELGGFQRKESTLPWPARNGRLVVVAQVVRATAVNADGGTSRG